MLFPLLLFFTLVSGANGKCAWDNCPKWSSDKINVHLICHTHDDMGWIKSVDDYFTGRHSDLVPVGVQYILNTVSDELAKDPRRRFSYAETGFLKRWLETEPPEKVKKLKAQIMETGQLELIGGGWTQPDEAATHYTELINNYALGLGILNATYGACGLPKVAWQIDPFGHSREHANLLTLMGYEALFFSRIHYLDNAKRAKEKSLEMVWTGSDDLKTDILTGDFYRGTYSPPWEFCFDPLCSDDPIIDNPQLEGYNLEFKIERFYNIVMEQVSTQRHNHVMMTMGGDFQYSNANMWFTNLDKLIDAFNAKSDKIHLFYSTPSCYVAALNQAAPRLPSKTSGDFFPYATSNHSYWTGYFTSKPGMKGLVRRSVSLLQLANQFTTVVSTNGDELVPKLDVFTRALALSTHHDAITGTSRENVTRDYERRLLIGWDAAEHVLAYTYAKITDEDPDSKAMEFCRRMNESVCSAIIGLKGFSVTVFNANAHKLSTIVRIPFYARNAVVRDENGQKVNAQLAKSFVPATQLHDSSSSPYELQIPIIVDPVGFKTYSVSVSGKGFCNGGIFASEKGRKKCRKHPWHQSAQPDGNNQQSSSTNEHATTFSISNDLIRLTFDPKTGLLVSFEDLRRRKTFALNQQFLYYKGMSHYNCTDPKNMTEIQASGAYIFRPNGTQPVAIERRVQLRVVKTALVQEVRQIVSPWICQVVRLLPGKAFVEFDYIVGPLPKNPKDLTTTEVITRYTVNGFNSNGVFWTDANGRQLIKRRRNDPETWFENTEPVSANYYPVNSRIIISNGESQLAVLTDRSHGGTSLRDGQVELMLHRRAFWDDGFGVEQPLDEPGDDGRGLVVRGRHWLSLTAYGDSSHRQLAFEMLHQPTIGFGIAGPPVGHSEEEDTLRRSVLKYSILTRELPPNVNLLSLERLDASTVLLRLEHIYQAEEDELLAQPTVVDLQNLFVPFAIISVEELMLAGNRPSERMGSSTTATVTLIPQEIKTLRLGIRPREQSIVTTYKDFDWTMN